MRSLPQCPRTPPQTGLRAALLAERGIAASLVALEGRYGLLSVFPVQPDLAALSGELGARFEISRNFYKPYACGIVIHPIVDAYLRLRRENAIDA